MNNEADFFVAGGTLRTSAPSYVTRPADAALLQHLQAGEFCYVLTPRQMGKSSLMVRTAQRLRAEGVRVVIIDLTSIGASSSAISADQWYLGLLSRMRSDLRLATDVQAWWQAHSAFSVAQRFSDFLQQVVLTECADKVVILIDEIDSTLTLPFRDDFFAAIRAIYNERANNPSYSRLTFALFGVATPTDLIQDRGRTPFNVGHRIDLREFTLADAEPLQQGLANQLPEQADAIFQRIFYWTNGHPYLTQKLCQAVVLHTTEWQEESVEQTVDQLVYTAFLSEEGRKDPNLTFVQDRIINSPEREQRQMLRLYRRVRSGERVADDDRSPIQNRLELYGLVGVTQGMLQVRNRIYEQVFTSVWVDSVMPTNRRQRNAWLAATIALLLVVGMSAFLLLQPDSTCSELQAQFEANTANSSIRLSALGGLFERVNTCGSLAIDLFYSLTPEEQITLFVGLSDPVGERTQLVTVIDGINRTLDTVPAHDQALMKIWLNVLRNAGLAESDILVASISNWKEGRQAFQDNNFQKAVISYDSAIAAVGDENHPVLHYDLALALIEMQEFTRALAELDEVVSMAPELFSPYTPTPEMTSTAIISPLESPEVRPNIISPIPDLVPIITVTTTTVSVSPLLVTETTTTATTKEPPITEAAFTNLYQQRFHTAEDIYSIVSQTLEENSGLITTLYKYATNYPALSDLQNVAGLQIQLVGLDGTSDSPTIEGNPTNFFATVITGTNVTYEWNFGDNSPLVQGSTISHTYAKYGDYWVTVSATNEKTSEPQEKSFWIMVLPAAPTGLTIEFTPTVVTVNSPVIFTAKANGSDLQYEWSFGDGELAVGQIVEHAFSQLDTYEVRIRARNSVGEIFQSVLIVVHDTIELIP